MRPLGSFLKRTLLWGIIYNLVYRFLRLCALGPCTGEKKGKFLSSYDLNLRKYIVVDLEQRFFKTFTRPSVRTYFFLITM